MKKHLSKPYYYLWFTSLVILIYRYIVLAKIGDSVLDINVHDTFYVISYWHITIVLCLFYLILGFVYCMFSKSNIALNRPLSNTYNT